MAFAPKRSLARLSVVFAGAILLAIVCAGFAASGARAAGGVNVFVGYADNLRANPVNFPTPWQGGTGVIYEGCSPSSSCVFDAGAVRVVNNTHGALTVNSVVLHFSAACTYNIWPHNVALPAGHELIVTQTKSGSGDGCSPSTGHMDSSDIGPGGVKWSGNCHQSGVIPKVDVTLDGTDSTFTDSGKVLNTGGVDRAFCGPHKGNESTQWTLIGNQPCPGANLTLVPPSQTHMVGTTATVTARLTNGCGTGLQGADIKFKATAGPNAGTTGSGATDATGRASFSYSSVKVGTDTLQASTSNPAGTITSNTVQVTWTVPFAPGGGSFVIGDENSTVGTNVTFWGGQWSRHNSLSGGPAPRSFKGFALNPRTPACGVMWNTGAGNSPPPPAGPLPAYMAVIVTSSVKRSGPGISGNTVHIVVVKTNPGYAPNPGHAGTGMVVSQVC